jgi:cleavage stimulation factor subunit 3
LENLKEYEGKETAQLIDRYKFLDLFPCTQPELKSVGYHEISAITQGTKLANQNHDDDDNQKILPRPDFSQMIPFKPKANSHPGDHPMGGGTFPQPPALAALCAVLPPPVCFRGPFVSVDKLFDVFNRIKIDSKMHIENIIATD